jgi:hypothetical protein
MSKNSVIPFPLSRKPPRAPAGLKKHGRALWRAIQSEYSVDDSGGVAFLTAACRAEDDIQRMRKALAVEGDTILDRFSQKQAHPLIPAIRGMEQVRRQNLAALALNIEPLSKDRPSGSRK